MVQNRKTFWNSIFKGQNKSVTVVTARTVQYICIYALYNMLGTAFARHYDAIKPQLKFEMGKASEVRTKVLKPLKEIFYPFFQEAEPPADLPEEKHEAFQAIQSTKQLLHWQKEIGYEFCCMSFCMPPKTSPKTRRKSPPRKTVSKKPASASKQTASKKPAEEEADDSDSKTGRKAPIKTATKTLSRISASKKHEKPEEETTAEVPVVDPESPIKRLFDIQLKKTVGQLESQINGQIKSLNDWVFGVAGLCNNNTKRLDSLADIMRCLSREFAGDFKQFGKLESRISDLERRVTELETYVEEIEAIPVDHESKTSSSKASDTEAKQAPTPAGVNDVALDEFATQAPTSTEPNDIVVDESATLAPNPQGQYEDSSVDSKYPSGVARAPSATSPSYRLQDSDEDSETMAKKQTSTSAEIVELVDSDMDQKPAAKPVAEKASLLDSSEKEVGSEKEGAGRKRKSGRAGESSDSSSQSTSHSQKLTKARAVTKRRRQAARRKFSDLKAEENEEGDTDEDDDENDEDYVE